MNHYPDHPYIGVRWDPREASALRRDLIEVLRQYSIVFMWERSLVERLQRDRCGGKISSLCGGSGIVSTANWAMRDYIVRHAISPMMLLLSRHILVFAALKL